MGNDDDDDDDKVEEQIGLPEGTGSPMALERAGKMWFITLHQDDSVMVNPCEDMDGLGTMHSLCRSHSNFNEQCPQLLKDDEDCVALSYFEHGQCLWFVEDSAIPAGVEFQWDGVRMAGVWEPDDAVRQAADSLGHKPATAARKTWMQKQAAACCTTYTCWCNGEVYGYSIEVYDKRYHEAGELFDELDDYRHDTPVHEDACFGFYGWDEVATAAREAMLNADAAIKKEKIDGAGD